MPLAHRLLAPGPDRLRCVAGFSLRTSMIMRALLPFRTALSSLALAALLSSKVLAAQPTPAPLTNPLLTESSLPYHLPPFAAIKDEHFAPAFEQGMADEIREV